MTYQPYSKHNNTPNLQKAKIFGLEPAFLSLFNPEWCVKQGGDTFNALLHLSCFAISSFGGLI